jgi:hypothetical protein
VIVLLALSLTPVTLESDEREDHAQELVSLAERRLALGWLGWRGPKHVESTIDNFAIKSPDTKDQKPSFVRRCLFGKKGSW